MNWTTLRLKNDVFFAISWKKDFIQPWIQNTKSEFEFILMDVTLQQQILHHSVLKNYIDLLILFKATSYLFIFTFAFN